MSNFTLSVPSQNLLSNTLKHSNFLPSSFENSPNTQEESDDLSFTESLYDNIEDFLDEEGLVLDGPPVVLSNNSLKPSFNNREMETMVGKHLDDENKLDDSHEEEVDLKSLLRLAGKGGFSERNFDLNED